jgi:predicted Zn-dependent protease
MTTDFNRIHDIVRKACSADDYSLSIRTDDSLETRFAQNAITQHLTGEGIGVSLHVAFGAQTGSAKINSNDPDTIVQLVKTAEETARVNQPDPEFVPSAEAAILPALDDFCPATAAVDEKTTVDNIVRCVEFAGKLGADISGFSSRIVTRNALFTKNGFAGTDAQTSFSHSMTMRKGAVETKVAQGVKDYATFSVEALLERLHNQYIALDTPQVFEPCRIPVILRPEAVCNLFLYLMWSMDRRDADEGVSPFANALGTAFFGSLFNMRSTLKDPALLTPLFGGGGIVSREIDWSQNGVLTELSTDRAYARMKGLVPGRFHNQDIAGGTTSDEEMMRMAGRGLIVNRMWYIRSVDARKGEYTGMTRDGVLYFEDGKIRHAVNNLRFNEVIYDVTRRILALGEQYQVEPDKKVPTMLVNDFNFVDRTSF